MHAKTLVNDIVHATVVWLFGLFFWFTNKHFYLIFGVFCIFVVKYKFKITTAFIDKTIFDIL